MTDITSEKKETILITPLDKNVKLNLSQGLDTVMASLKELKKTFEGAIDFSLVLPQGGIAITSNNGSYQTYAKHTVQARVFGGHKVVSTPLASLT